MAQNVGKVVLTTSELGLILEALDTMNGGAVSLDRYMSARVEALWQKIDTEIDSRDA